jgi:hypothetical protein
MFGVCDVRHIAETYGELQSCNKSPVARMLNDLELRLSVLEGRFGDRELCT